MRYHPLCFIPFLILIFLSACQNTSPPNEDGGFQAVAISEETITQVFEEMKVEGCLVILDQNTGQRYLHNPMRAGEEFLPASTFKIPHTLIGLETDKVSISETFPWDGTERSNAQWNQEQTLASAFEYSTVWVYQEIARRIGEEEMQLKLDYLGYGNGDISGGIDQFWLTGGLRISAIDQVQFLQRLVARSLPLKPSTYDQALPIFLEEETKEYRLFGKTGWANHPDPNIGWYIGWVERGEESYFFALNIDIENSEDADKRKSIVRSILSDNGILPAKSQKK